jgi:glycosyltransferase involved in cell wall biosynthesis
MLNVVVVSDFAYVEGGNSAVALASAIGLADAGHRVTLLSAVPPIDPAVQKSVSRVVCTGQHAIADDPERLRALVQGLWNRTAGRAMLEVLSTLDPHQTVVHVHGWTKALSSSVIRAALSQKFKVVCTLHDYFTACPNGSFFNYATNAICELQPLSSSCIATQCDRRHYGQKLWRVARQVVQNRFGGLPRDVRDFIVVSPFSEHILKPFLSPDARMYHVQNPVQTSYQDPVDVAANATFVMVGRLAQEKGPALFAEAAHLSGCDAVFIGDGDQRAAVLGRCRTAKMMGWLPRDEVTAQLKQARALVFPSLLYETEGLAVVEAAALGIPAIVSDASAARLSVIDGVTGSWFKAGDSGDLAKKMVALLDPQRASAMGHAAHQQYWKHPRTLDRHIKELERTYEQVLLC